MKAAKTDARPSFQLMKQNDIVSFFHLQMPRWLFATEKYKPLSLEAKVAYTFLLNRFQLSRLNGWVNNSGEVFVIFTRESLADEMQITYKKSIAAFKELSAANLIWEKRVGRGNANQIYLAMVELPTADANRHTTAPFGNEEARPAISAHHDSSQENTRPADLEHQDLPSLSSKTCQNSTSRHSISAVPDLPKQHPSKKDINNTEKSHTEKVSPSVSAQTDDASDEELERLLEHCELWVLPEEMQGVFQSAIERLYYSAFVTIGNARLPQARVRPHLWKIDGMVVGDAYQKLRCNTTQKVKNSTNYLVSTLFNAIYEGQSDLAVDPFLNTMHSSAREVGT